MQPHKVQMLILKQLLFHPNSRFRDLNLTGLSNDHFSYHINGLVKSGLVSKTTGRYSLSIKGKKFAGMIDTKDATLEKQPKVSVLIITERLDGRSPQYLWQKRMKEPYFGYSGFFTGKIKFGEGVLEAAARELQEETGLTAELEHKFVLHELVFSLNGEILEDKHFNIIHAFNPKGKLLEKTEDGVNFWVTEEKMIKTNPKYHNEMEIFYLFKKNQRQHLERKYFIEGF